MRRNRKKGDDIADPIYKENFTLIQLKSPHTDGGTNISITIDLNACKDQGNELLLDNT